MKGALYGPGLGASAPSARAPCLPQPSATFPLLHVKRAAAPSSPVATQQRSIVLRQSPFQGHIIAALDTAGLFSSALNKQVLALLG